MKPVNVAIIGCGGYASQLIKRIWTLPRSLRLVAATSRNPESPDALACAARGARIFPGTEELLEFVQGKAEAILNPTPIPQHARLTRQCLEAGFPVWLEKPPVATLEELDEILAVSRRTGLRVDVCFNSVYSHNVQRLKAELLRGAYGNLNRVRSVAGWPRTDAYFRRAGWAGKLKNEGQWVLDGTINNPLAHVVFNNLFFAGSEQDALAGIARVEAELYHAHEIESEDTSSLRILTTGGIEILSQLTLCPEQEITALTVLDTDDAEITLRDFETVEIAWRDGRREVWASYKENRIEMLETLCLSLREEGRPICTLESCRPFTDVVNRAFFSTLEKHGKIPDVRPGLLDRHASGETFLIRIRGIDAAIAAAHEQGKLLSEGNPGWLTEEPALAEEAESLVR